MWKRKAALVALIGSCVAAWPAASEADHWPKEKLSINLSLSGGGIRASAFAQGVLLELDEIFLCWEGTGEDKKLSDVRYSRRSDKSNPGNCKNPTTLLKSLDTISAVSGGAITAAYYKASDGDAWKQSFREALTNKDIQKELLTRIQSNSALLPDVAFRPALAVTSLIDVAKYLVTAPFKMVGLSASLRNPDLTPALFLASGQGLIKPDEMSEVYRNWFWPKIKKELSFGDYASGKVGSDKPVKLLINATDIKNGSIFTFDENTFTCMGLSPQDFFAFPVSRALAASSALPVIFSPHNLSKLLENARPEKVNGENCPVLSTDHTRSPLLLDGGIVENLGLARLLQDAFWRKNHTSNPHHNAAEQTFLISVNAAVQGGSGLPTLGKGSTIPQDLDQSFDVLMTNKTDVTRTIFESALHPFGFRFLELRFPDINRANIPPVETNFTTERVALQRLGVPFGKQLSKSELTKMAEESALFRQERDKVFQDLNAIGMAPTKEQIDLLISAGRAVIADRFDEIKEQLAALTAQEFQEVCGDIFNIDKHYCWPQELTDRNLLRSPLRVVLSRLDTVKEQHIKRITVNRTRAVASLRDRIRNTLLNELELVDKFQVYFDGGYFVGKILCQEVVSRDLDYFRLYRKAEKSSALRDLLSRCEKITKVWKDLASRDEEYKNPDAYKHPAERIAGREAVKKNDHFLRSFVAAIENSLQASPSIEQSLPEYYGFLIGSARLIYLQDPSGLTLLYKNRTQGPLEININEQLAMHMILKRSEYTMGLRHILIALEHSRLLHKRLAEDSKDLDLMATVTDRPSLSIIQHQQQRFLAAEYTYKLLFAKLHTASPKLVEVNGSSTSQQGLINHDISEQDITDWANAYYPDGTGGTVIGLPEGPYSDMQLAHRHCLLQEIFVSLQMENRKRVQDCKQDKNILDQQKLVEGIEALKKKIAQYAAQDIKKTSGLKLALRYAEEAYRDPKSNEYLGIFHYHRPLYWGLALLVASAEAACPERRQAVETARELIRDGATQFRELKDMYPPEFDEYIQSFEALPYYFECGRGEFLSQNEVARSN